MAAVIVEIADAMVDALNAGSFSQAFTASRHYMPRIDRTNFTGLSVKVVPHTLESAPLDRSRRKLYQYQVTIGIQKVIGSGSMTEADILAAVDPLMLFVQEIGDFFNTAALEGYETAVCTGFENQPIYAAEHLDGLRLFTSILTFTFTVAR